MAQTFPPCGAGAQLCDSSQPLGVSLPSPCPESFPKSPAPGSLPAAAVLGLQLLPFTSVPCVDSCSPGWSDHCRPYSRGGSVAWREPVKLCSVVFLSPCDCGVDPSRPAIPTSEEVSSAHGCTEKSKQGYSFLWYLQSKMCIKFKIQKQPIKLLQ